MPERTDPFEVLRRPIVAARPRPRFAAELERRLREELDMSLIDDPTTDGAAPTAGALGLVHFQVADADRAMRFFGDLFGWVGERAAFDDHVSHYTLNTTVTVRLLDDPAAASVRPNYQVTDVRRAVRAIEAAGGHVTDSDVAADGGGWAFADDPDGVPLLVYRPSDRYHAASDVPVSGEVALVLLQEDATVAGAFYESVLGWLLRPPHPGSSYFDTVDHVGILDRNALGDETAAQVTLLFDVPALRPAVERIVALGGSTEPVSDEPTMGPYFSVLCTDDQGTRFGLMSVALDSPED